MRKCIAPFVIMFVLVCSAALAGTAPFIMKPDGLAWLYVPNGLVDGPLPTHYEPAESPVRNLLYGVGSGDPLTFVLVSLVLAAVTVLASYIPARRATRIDPMVSLRYE